jgi:YYY domain-containing protein
MIAREAIFHLFQWYLIITLAGIATYPFVYQICNQLWDRGISIARAVGLAILILPFWMIGNIIPLPNHTILITTIGALIGLASWAIAFRQSDFHAFLANRWRTILTFELATFALFFGYSLFRSFNPAVRGTEKPMELAFLNAFIQGDVIPANDPWFAGEAINYYSLGYAVYGAVACVSGVPGEIAFNLSLGIVFALSVVAAAGLSANISVAMSGYQRLSSILSAVLGGFFVGVAGNLHTARELVLRPAETLGASWWAGVGWTSSRVIEDGGFADGSTRTVITEFPSFSWVLGDLHPHVIAYPWLIASFALVFNFAVAAYDRSNRRDLVLASIPIGVITGVLYAANSWDMPIAIGLFVVALVLGLRTTATKNIALAGISALLAATITTLPFAMSYEPPTGSGTVAPENRFSGIERMLNSIGYVAWDRSSFTELLIHWGPLIILCGFVAVILLHRFDLFQVGDIKCFVIAIATLTILAFLLDAPATLLLGGLAFTFLIMMWRLNTNVAAQSVASFITVATLTVLFTEFFFIQDVFGDRMNTVFKIAFQAWALLSIAVSAVIGTALAHWYRRQAPRWYSCFVGATAVVVLAASVYAPLSIQRWSETGEPSRDLDGLRYIQRAQPDEHAAINWVNRSDEAFEVLLEAPGCSYGTDNSVPHNRVSMATGIPTVIGWNGHQVQWRRGQPQQLAEIGQRIEHVREMYEQPASAGSLFDSYAVTHVYIGIHETTGYRQCDTGGPYDLPDHEYVEDLGWQKIYGNDTVQIYRLPESASEN